MQDLPQQGSLSEFYLPRLFGRLHRAGFEGTVRVGLAETTKVVYLRRGDIASAASNAEPDRLANILIRDGRLTEAQLELAKQRAGEGGSLGKTLIELGFLSPTELLQGARHQVREILASCFALSNGTFQIEPGPLPAEVTSLGLPTRRLIFDCVLQASERQTVLREVGSMETVYKPGDDLAAALDVLRLDPETDRVARSLDGSSSLGDLSGRTALDDFMVSRVILGLEVLGLAEKVGAPLAVPATEVWQEVDIAASRPAVPSSETISPSPADEAGIPIFDEPEEPAATDATEEPRIGLTPPPVPEPEPPPIPDDELPAFAVAESPAEATPSTTWQIDQETGERVRMGPVEMTFDGEIVPRSRRTVAWPRLLAAAAVVVLGVGALFVVLSVRRGSREAARAAAAGAGDRPSPAIAQARPPSPVTTPSPAAPPPRATPSPREVPPPAPSGTPAERKVPPTERTVPPAPAGTEPASTPPRTVPRGSTSPFRDAGRYMTTLARVDAGDVAGAARVFQELTAAEGDTSVTLQLMIACVEDTVRNARARSGEGGSLFFVPYTLKGRSCYRVCWGVYDSKEEAREAFGAIPPALRSSGSPPVPVPLAAFAPDH